MITSFEVSIKDNIMVSMEGIYGNAAIHITIIENYIDVEANQC